MADEQQANNVEETKTPQEPMPSSDQKSTTNDGVAQPAERDSQATQSKEVGLPDSASDRTTQQFEKLKKQLAEEREKRTRLERLVDAPQPKQQEGGLPEWYNPETREVDVEKLQAERAREKAELESLKRQIKGVSRLTEEQQEKEAYTSYPELNPKSDDFDNDFQEQVVSYMATRIARGENPTIKEAADKIMSLVERRSGQAKVQRAKEAIEKLTPKEQASLEATGRSDRRLPRNDIEELRLATRYGGRSGLNAAAARMRGTPEK